MRALAADVAPVPGADRQQGQGQADLRRAASKRESPAKSLKGIHAPIGLDIGAITPQEIAVSILAELIAVKHGRIAGANIAAVSMRWEGALAEALTL